MIMQMFSIFDVKAKAYTQPFFMPQKGQALRDFDGVVNNEQTPVNKYPEDFSLYKLGEFDNISGKVVSLNQPEFLANAVDFVKKEKNGG